MYMNYMDYTDDACRNLFTNGQALRMQALFKPGGVRENFGNFNTTLTGTNLVCESPSTFTLNNVPQGATVSWSVSNAAIISISSSTNTQAEVQWNNSLGVFDNRGKVRVIARRS